MNSRNFAVGTLGILYLTCLSTACSAPPTTSATGGIGGGGIGGKGGGGTAGMGGSSGCGPEAGAGGIGGEFSEPKKLSETGLYRDIRKQELAPCVEKYEPYFHLWSDGADKERFIYLPPGSKIDTSDMDYWKFPVGTKLWKAFVRAKKGSDKKVVVETRILQKISDTANDPEQRWFRRAFEWLEDGSDAVLIKDEDVAVEDALGTPHNIPRRQDCGTCHYKLERKDGDAILGFSAIQLSHNLGGLNLDQLIQRKWLSHPPQGPFKLPGTLDEQLALGYLHSNCGNCHNAKAGEVQGKFFEDLVFWLSVDKLGSVEETPTFLTTVNKRASARSSVEGPGMRIVPKKPAESAVLYRMKLDLTVAGQQEFHMPPLAVEERDPKGENAVEAWINSL